MTRLVFSAATLVALAHALEDAFLHGSLHFVAAAISVAAAVAALVAFPRLRPGLQAAVAFGFGALAVVNGALHVRHMDANGFDLGHASGVLVLAAGVVLIGVAVWIPWQHRGEGSWKSRSVAVPAAFLASVFVLGPVILGIADSHKFRDTIGAPPDAAYQTVRFEAGDGVELAGWYRPTSNGSTVLLAHGGGSDREGSVAHARMLSRHGYGVLLYDARGAGESDGRQNSYGWGWTHDVEGALDFLAARPEVDRERIGALGLSTGADVLLEIAAERPDLGAVVADGAAAGSFEDWRRLRGTEVGLPPGWLMFKTIEVMTSSSPGRALEDQVARIESPLLLISAGEAEEREFNALYEEASGGHAEHWSLPAAHHTAAIREEAAAYERKVVGFFDQALSHAR
jgi:uncharacterized protein